ncbi:SDR family NAD(P)-dependent oxidoreductase [Microbacterium sp. B2969]|uniref:3beta-hydroxysteroid 3-dehydrogenase n=1 Tax=Microbacterium alkaliflavum TaxID=3248839 RepID=A0ABW7Q8C5_9MICO
MARPDWDPQHLPDMRGRTYLVTGSNAGLGYFAVEQLAATGAEVIMTARNPNRLSAARAAVLRKVPDARLESLIIDTSNLGSVRAAAATVRGRGRLDGVLLNAGIVHAPKERQQTPDGNELVFATNALGHYALAGELLTSLAGWSGRMVWLGSMSTAISPYDPVDPQLRKNYTAWRAYVQSKVATSVLGFEADRRLRAAGVHVWSIVAHPGYSTSGRTADVEGVNEPTRSTRVGGALQAAFSQSKERGAWPLVRALVDPTVVGGDFVGPRFGARGEPRITTPARIVRSPEIAERIWSACEDATRLLWPFEKAAKVKRR